MNRRERTRIAARKALARQWAEQAESAQPTSNFSHLPADLASTPVLLACRVSTPKQAKDLPAQLTALRQAVIASKGHVVATVAYVANGADPTRWEYVAQQARSHNAHAIVWESACRALRHPDWGKDHSLEPTPEQLDHFAHVFHGFTLYTQLPPDADQYEIWQHQIQRGRLLGGKGGRGNRYNRNAYRKQRKEALYPIALQLQKQDYGYGRIAQELGVTKALIQEWFRLR